MIKSEHSNEEIQRAIMQQAGKLLSQIAGHVGVRTMEMGLRFGLFEEIAKHSQGITAEALAKQKGLDPRYVQVWCRSAFAAELLEVGENQTYKLAPYMDKLLLDRDFPGYIGAVPAVMVQPEMFDYFAERLPTGQRIWWDKCSPGFIRAVSGTGRPFYNRLIPGGLSKVPGLKNLLDRDTRVLELACGSGVGLIRMAQTYPQCTLVGVDGDAYSLDVAAENLRQVGIKDRVSLTRSALEDVDATNDYDLVYINISMHECRDIEKVASNVHRALRPNGYFVISDFPFPDFMEGCRAVPARIMCGIQFFEALIDDQLLPTQAFITLLRKRDFRNVGAFDLTPMHAVTYGQK